MFDLNVLGAVILEMLVVAQAIDMYAHKKPIIQHVRLVVLLKTAFYLFVDHSIWDSPELCVTDHSKRHWIIQFAIDELSRLGSLYHFFTHQSTTKRSLFYWGATLFSLHNGFKNGYFGSSVAN